MPYGETMDSKVLAFRGQADENWILIPRLFRKQKSDVRLATQQFAKHRMTTWQFMSDLITSRMIPEELNLSYLEMLAVVQHYSEYDGACGTELLDFSWSRGVAASFAFDSTDENNIGVIYTAHPPEFEELLLGIFDEITLPDFFVRPKRQRAVFLRQFGSGVNEPALLTKYYFRQGNHWPSNLGPEYSQGYLLNCPDDPVLQFAQNWRPYVSPKISENDLRFLTGLEYSLLGMGTKPKHTVWQWLDAIQESIYSIYCGHNQKARCLLSMMDKSAFKDTHLEGELIREIELTIELIMSLCLQLEGHFDTAEERITRLLTTETTIEGKKLLLNHLGGIYGRRSKWDKAYQTYMKAASLTPNDLVTVFNIAITLKSMGEYQGALHLLNRIVAEIDSDDALSWSERANALNNLGEFKSAVNSAQRAIDLDPNLFEAWSHQGVGWLGLRNASRAADCFRIHVSHRPNDTWTLFNYCAALHYLGNRSESIEVFMKLEQLNPNYPRLCELGKLIGVDD